MIFSTDGKRVAYKAENHDEFFFIIEGKAGKYFNDDFQITDSFIPDHLRFSYTAEMNTKCTVMLDESESVPYDDVLLFPLCLTAKA